MSASCCNRDCSAAASPPDDRYRRVLWVALGINLAMFAVEIAASLLSASVSLRADALDFLGDAANYGLALAVFGMALRWRASAALVKGGVMGAFGAWVAGSTIDHAISATVPKAEVMSTIGFVALAANLAVAALLYRYRRGDSQALSVWLCTRNDCLVNLAVIAAGAGVWASGTPWPDIAVAAVIAWLGLSSAVRVIRLALREMRGSATAIAARERYLSVHRT
ncbi:MAG TPA: cation transporter [Stellaceae bacterium]|nr:cation transporter [Stellaceae bacterium]